VINGLFRTQRRRVVTEKFTTRRILRIRNARRRPAALQAKRVSQDSQS